MASPYLDLKPRIGRDVTIRRDNEGIVIVVSLLREAELGAVTDYCRQAGSELAALGIVTKGTLQCEDGVPVYVMRCSDDSPLSEGPELETIVRHATGTSWYGTATVTTVTHMFHDQRTATIGEIVADAGGFDEALFSPTTGMIVASGPLRGTSFSTVVENNAGIGLSVSWCSDGVISFVDRSIRHVRSTQTEVRQVCDLLRMRCLFKQHTVRYIELNG